MARNCILLYRIAPNRIRIHQIAFDYIGLYQVASDCTGLHQPGCLSLDSLHQVVKWPFQSLRFTDKGKAAGSRESPSKALHDVRDKLSFTFGVLVVCCVELVVLWYPVHLPEFYTILSSALVAARYVRYKRLKRQLFLIDFCYFFNTSLMLQMIVAPSNRLWFEVNYIAAMGPVCSAIYLNRNSLVFHDLDKLTGFLIHILPAVVVHGIR